MVEILDQIVNWMLIPKGIQNNKFIFSVVAILNQNKYNTNQNWTEFVVENLKGFNIKIDGLQPVEKEIDKSRLAPKLWHEFFPNSSESQETSFKSWKKLQDNRKLWDELSDATFDLIDANLYISDAHYAKHIAVKGPLKNTGIYLHSPIKINHLFDDENSAYNQLASFYLPPKPSFESRIDALKARDEIKKNLHITGDGKGFINNVIDQLEYQNDTRNNSKVLNPVCSKSAIDSLSIEYNNLKSGKKTKGFLNLLSQYFLSTAPLPNSPENGVDHESPQNRMAMLMSEPGLLSSFGMVFDLDIEVTLPNSNSLICVQPIWENKLETKDSTPTLTSPEGLAVSIDSVKSVYDARGYLKLANTDNFKIADFHPEMNFKKHTLAAQSDRNKLPKYSPGTSFSNMLDFELIDFTSDDVGLFWSGHSRKFQKDLIGLYSSCFYLEDLVIGVRPYWGHVNQNNIRWFNLTAKKVTYANKIESMLKRKATDIARDDSIVFLNVNSQIGDSQNVVFDVIAKTNGWGLGLKLPGEENISKVFGKNESLDPTRQYPAQRYGNLMYMAAALVYRDGSSNSDDKVKTDLKENGFELIAGESKGKPFRLSRWERLKSPVILHNTSPLNEWWPNETVENIVVTTSKNSQFRSQASSSRYLVPDKMDVMQVWKHGCFEKSPPKRSAFRNINMDKDGGFLVDKVSGEPLLKFISPRADFEEPFYHPDPLIESFVLNLVRRDLPKSNQVYEIKINDESIVKEFKIYHKNKWPNAEPLKIEVKAIPRHSIDESPLKLTENILEIFVPEGEEFSLLVTPKSSRVNELHGFSPEKVQERLKRFKLAENEIISNHFNINKSILDLNPNVTNSRIIDIHHVSLKPILWPSCKVSSDANFRLVRDKDSTQQRIECKHLIDIGSTSALELFSTWKEPQRNLLDLINGVRNNINRSDLVGKIDFNQIHTQLPQVQKDKLLRDPMELKGNFIQDFKDFKHRKVAYWATAISKADQNIKAAKLNAEDYSLPAFAVGNKLALEALEKDNFVDKNISVVHVLASKRPPPPKIRYLMPAFRFDTEQLNQKIRRYKTSILSLHMDGDWDISGEDEKLAIILLNKPSGSYENIRKKYNEYASFWGADPIRQSTSSLSRLPDYIGKEHFVGDLKFKDYLLDKQYDLSLLLLEPQICKESMSWRIEIPIINPSAVSKPFVRFAFARYQEYALEELNLSNIVIADYIQLSDSREVVIFRNPQYPNKIDLTIYGSYSEGDYDSASFNMSAWLEYKFNHFTDDSDSIWIKDDSTSIKEIPRTIRDGKACWHCTLEANKKLSDLRVALVEVEKYKISTNQEQSGERPIYFDVVPLTYLD